MAFIAPAVALINPHYVMPEIILQYQQPSGAFEAIATGNPMVRLSDGTLQAYIKRFNVRTKAAAGQQSYDSLPGVSMEAEMIGTPTYLVRNRAEYNHHETAAAAQWGASIVDAHRLAMRQGIFQEMRNALLYGFNPANGEGLLNTNGATSLNLPPDSNGNDTISTYDNGQLSVFLLQQIGATKTSMNQIGLPAKVTILTTQRILAALSYQNIVQLTQFQRVGGGVDSTRGVTDHAAGWNGDDITWVCDDTLIGKGAGGSDVILISIPEIKKPMGGKINTNEFARLSPGFEGTSLMLCDMAAPREIPTPIPGGAIDIVSELRITSGWCVRPEGVRIISAVY